MTAESAGPSNARRPFATLLRVLQFDVASGGEQPVMPRKLESILRENREALLRTTAFFSGSAASAQHEASGSRFGEFHEEWRLVAKNLSELVQIPLSVAEEQVYKYARMHASAEQLVASVDAVLLFYFEERAALLSCVLALLNLSLDSEHPYHLASISVVNDLSQGGQLGQSVLERFEEAVRRGFPPRIAAEDSEKARRWADQTVLEQALLLQIIFMLFYKDKGPVKSDDVLRFVNIAAATRFGNDQPLFSYLSERGARVVERIRGLWVLVLTELLSFEKLLEAWEHLYTPGFPERTSALAKDRRKVLGDAIQLIIEHPLSQVEDRQELDAVMKRLGSIPECGAVRLAWGVCLAHCEELQGERQRLETALRESKPYLPSDAETFAGDVTALSRIAEALKESPFPVFVSVLRALRPSLSDGDRPDPIHPAYASVVKNMVLAFFQYLDDDSFMPELLALTREIHSGERLLARQFWKVDAKNRVYAKLLDYAVRVFPLDSCTLLELLECVSADEFSARRAHTFLRSELTSLLLVLDSDSALDGRLVQPLSLPGGVLLPPGLSVEQQDDRRFVRVRAPVGWNAWHFLFGLLEEQVEQGLAEGACQWQFLTAFLGLLQRLLAEDPTLLSQLQRDAAVALAGRASDEAAFGATEHHERPVRLTKLLLHCLRLASLHSQNGTLPQATQPERRSSVKVEALVGETHPVHTSARGSTALQLIHACTACLEAAARQRPHHFLSVLVSTTERSEMPLLAMQRLVFNRVEFAEGTYPATRCFLEMLHHLLPSIARSLGILRKREEDDVVASVPSFQALRYLQYVYGDVFVGYEHWRYRRRTERWQVGLAALRILYAVLSSMDALIDVQAKSGDALSHKLHRAFLLEPAMQRALLKPLLMGASVSARLRDERRIEELKVYEQLLVWTFRVLHLLLQFSTDRTSVDDASGDDLLRNDVAAKATGPAERGGMRTEGSRRTVRAAVSGPASFEQALFEGLAQGGDPGSGMSAGAVSGGASASGLGAGSDSRSLLQSIVAYTAPTSTPELRRLAMHTLALLCRSGAAPHVSGMERLVFPGRRHDGPEPSSESQRSPYSLAAYIGSSVAILRKSMLRALTGKVPALREVAFELLVAAFDFQPALAEALLLLRLPVGARATTSAPTAAPRDATGREGWDEDGAEDGDGSAEPAGEHKHGTPYERGSVLVPLLSYVGPGQDNARRRPRELAQVLRVLHAIFQAAPGFHNLAAYLRTQASLWRCLFDMIAAEPEVSPLGHDMPQRQLEETVPQFCYQLLARSWAFRLVAVEVHATTALRGAAEPSEAVVEGMRYLLEKGVHELIASRLLQWDYDPRLVEACIAQAQLRRLKLPPLTHFSTVHHHLLVTDEATAAKASYPGYGAQFVFDVAAVRRYMAARHGVPLAQLADEESKVAASQSLPTFSDAESRSAGGGSSIAGGLVNESVDSGVGGASDMQDDAESVASSVAFISIEPMARRLFQTLKLCNWQLSVADARIVLFRSLSQLLEVCVAKAPHLLVGSLGRTGLLSVKAGFSEIGAAASAADDLQRAPTQSLWTPPAAVDEKAEEVRVDSPARRVPEMYVVSIARFLSSFAAPRGESAVHRERVRNVLTATALNELCNLLAALVNALVGVPSSVMTDMWGPQPLAHGVMPSEASEGDEPSGSSMSRGVSDLSSGVAAAVEGRAPLERPLGLSGRSAVVVLGHVCHAMRAVVEIFLRLSGPAASSATMERNVKDANGPAKLEQQEEQQRTATPGFFVLGVDALRSLLAAAMVLVPWAQSAGVAASLQLLPHEECESLVLKPSEATLPELCAQVIEVCSEALSQKSLLAVSIACMSVCTTLIQDSQPAPRTQYTLSARARPTPDVVRLERVRRAGSGDDDLFVHDVLPGLARGRVVDVLLRRLARCGRRDGLPAFQILSLFEVLARCPHGAEHLFHSSLMLYLTNSAMARGEVSLARYIQVSAAAAATAAASDLANARMAWAMRDDGGEDTVEGGGGRGDGDPSSRRHTGTAPQKASGSVISSLGGVAAAAGDAVEAGPDSSRETERNPWHLAWCAALALMRNMVRELSTNEEFMGQVVEFLSVFERPLLAALHPLGAASGGVLSFGGLDELEKASAFAYELERSRGRWRFYRPQLAEGLERSMGSLVQELVLLLRDADLLQRTAAPLARAERESAGFSRLSDSEARARGEVVAKWQWVTLGSPRLPLLFGAALASLPMQRVPSSGAATALSRASEASSPLRTAGGIAGLWRSNAAVSQGVGAAADFGVDVNASASGASGGGGAAPGSPSKGKGGQARVKFGERSLDTHVGSVRSGRDAEHGGPEPVFLGLAGAARSRAGLRYPRALLVGAVSVGGVGWLGGSRASSLLSPPLCVGSHFSVRTLADAAETLADRRLFFAQRIEYAACVVLRNALSTMVANLLRVAAESSSSGAPVPAQALLFSHEVKLSVDDLKELGADASSTLATGGGGARAVRTGEPRLPQRPPLATLVQCIRYCVPTLRQLDDTLALCHRQRNSGGSSAGSDQERLVPAIIAMDEVRTVVLHLVEQALLLLLLHVRFFVSQRPFPPKLRQEYAEELKFIVDEQLGKYNRHIERSQPEEARRRAFLARIELELREVFPRQHESPLDVPPDHRRLFAANGGHVSAEPVAQDSLLAFADDNDEQTESAQRHAHLVVFESTWIPTCLAQRKRLPLGAFLLPPPAYASNAVERYFQARAQRYREALADELVHAEDRPPRAIELSIREPHSDSGTAGDFVRGLPENRPPLSGESVSRQELRVPSFRSIRGRNFLPLGASAAAQASASAGTVESSVSPAPSVEPANLTSKRSPPARESPASKQRRVSLSNAVGGDGGVRGGVDDGGEAGETGGADKSKMADETAPPAAVTAAAEAPRTEDQVAALAAQSPSSVMGKLMSQPEARGAVMALLGAKTRQAIMSRRQQPLRSAQ